MIQENWMIGDLHIHSCYSRACSKNINFENLVKWAKVKGLHLLGTGDFTHPLWMEEIKKLKPNSKGIYYYEDFPFIISGEVSLMYTAGKGRRIHLVLLVPDIETAEKINVYLDKFGRRDYDGRPIFKIPVDKFARDMFSISKQIEIIPAHIWTPWFGIFGSSTGFDSLKEAFGSEFENISAIETGMSSDPEMNWKISELNNKSILSFSDSHSFWPWRLGREATIFSKTDSYLDILKQIRDKTILGTIETDPAYGKYHYDGHRLCSFSCSFLESGKLKNICPKCNSPLTIGVENRVNFLKNQDISKHNLRKPFFKLLPLHELISAVVGSSLNSKKVWNIYNSLIEKFGNELNILLDVSEERLREISDVNLIELILKNRNGNIFVKPGYDGVYGKAIVNISGKEVIIGEEEDKIEIKSDVQKRLF